MDTATETVELVDDAFVRNLVRAALFAALMGAFSYVSFPYPLSPAPVTLQVLGVFLAGIMLGATWGGIAMGFYLLAGAMGAPVFAMGSAGLGVLVGESGGFLLAFPIAAVVIGVLVHGGFSVRDGDHHTARLVGGMVAGVAIIYVMGVIGMILVLSLSPIEAILFGAVAFLPAEAAKIAAAVGIVRSERLAAV